VVSPASFEDWAVPLYRAFGIEVRLHLLFILLILGYAIEGWAKGRLGWTMGGMGALFGIVLLHEYGHCIACRWVGGEADRIVLWPLGGLAFCRPPHNWRAELITVIGGPAVNVVLGLVFAGALLAMGGGTGSIVFNPFNPAGALVGTSLVQWWQYLTWWLYYTNLVLLAFNVLLPMFPMDGGRMWQCILWRSMGYRRSMQIAVNVGLVIAVVLAFFAVFSGETQLLGIALFGGFECWTQRMRLKYAAEGDEASPWAESLAWREDDERRKFNKAAKKQQREATQARDEQAEVDRILAKIATEGMASLTRGEKKVLERETERKRAGER
jgi:Zn-dependent protease